MSTEACSAGKKFALHADSNSMCTSLWKLTKCAFFKFQALNSGLHLGQTKLANCQC